jgi:hypothetical protein
MLEITKNSAAAGFLFSKDRQTNLLRCPKEKQLILK